LADGIKIVPFIEQVGGKAVAQAVEAALFG